VDKIWRLALFVERGCATPPLTAGERRPASQRFYGIILAQVIDIDDYGFRVDVGVGTAAPEFATRKLKASLNICAGI